MKKLFENFDYPTKDQWVEKLKSDLKGKPESLLAFKDTIEEIEIPCYAHGNDLQDYSLVENEFSLRRGQIKPSNEWNNSALIIIEDEKHANTEALKALNLGADSLVFKAEKPGIVWSIVFDHIQFEYIHTQFHVSTIEEGKKVLSLIEKNNNVRIGIDLFRFPEVNLSDLEDNFFLSVNGYNVQQAGATSWQEIAFCLGVAHDYILQLSEAGIAPQSISKRIQFNLGIGANYFVEIAKFRTLRMLWSSLLDQYNIDQYCSIHAIAGFVNKSLKDPNTNLLRLTTEALSALTAGVDAIILQPYDSLSHSGTSELARRMVINIPTILKEESYIDKVIDPNGGSYTIETLTQIIGEKAWGEFKKLDADGGLTMNGLDNFIAEVEDKKRLRIKVYNKKEKTLIGVNKFLNEDASQNQWKEGSNYLGFKQLILENEIKA